MRPALTYIPFLCLFYSPPLSVSCFRNSTYYIHCLSATLARCFSVSNTQYRYICIVYQCRQLSSLQKVFFIALQQGKQFASFHYQCRQFPLECVSDTDFLHFTISVQTVFFISLYQYRQFSSFHCISTDSFFHCTVPVQTVFFIALYQYRQFSSLNCISPDSFLHCTVSVQTVFFIALHQSRQFSSLHCISTDSFLH